MGVVPPTVTALLKVGIYWALLDPGPSSTAYDYFASGENLTPFSAKPCFPIVCDLLLSDYLKLFLLSLIEIFDSFYCLFSYCEN